MKHPLLFIMPAMLNGGAEKVLIDILKHFDYSRYNVTLLLECKEGPYICDIPNEVELIYLHKKNLWIERLYRYMIIFHFKWLVYLLLCYLPLSWKLRGRQFHTIVSFMEGMAVRMHSYIYDKARRNISWVHIDFQKKHWSLDFFKDKKDEYNCYQKMDKIVFVSQEAKERFKEIYKIDDQKLEVVNNLIDRDEILKLANSKIIQKEKFTICMVGRLNHQKRYDRALKAASKLKNAGYDFELWILGNGELEDELRRMTEKFNLTDTVIFKGFSKPAYSYMKTADIFLNTSESEGYPLTLCEALCLGLPIVATANSGSNELITASGAGMLTKDDEDDIFECLEKVMSNQKLRLNFSDHAIKYSHVFNVNKSMHRIYNLI